MGSVLCGFALAGKPEQTAGQTNVFRVCVLGLQAVLAGGAGFAPMEHAAQTPFSLRRVDSADVTATLFWSPGFSLVSSRSWLCAMLACAGLLCHSSST